MFHRMYTRACPSMAAVSMRAAVGGLFLSLATRAHLLSTLSQDVGLVKADFVTPSSPLRHVARPRRWASHEVTTDCGPRHLFPTYLTSLSAIPKQPDAVARTGRPARGDRRRRAERERPEPSAPGLSATY